ncbi:hypothetical protein VMCG_05786 [Cytospora schulzeri]|uniref:Uncharacterized protein n=1 Tax=Cytospora schulzeri TaxID=448051 RepID=A0A423WIG7_9PEZI|nr:hypothetical protein VMCG_05786 [Valsa malicola]
MVLLSLRAGRGGADPPTGLNRTMTFSRGNVVPTSDRAVVASRGRLVSTREAVMVRGRSGESLVRSGMSGLAGLSVAVPAVPVPVPMGAGAGDDVEGCGGEDMAVLGKAAAETHCCAVDQGFAG